MKAMKAMKAKILLQSEITLSQLMDELEISICWAIVERDKIRESLLNTIWEELDKIPSESLGFL